MKINPKQIQVKKTTTAKNSKITIKKSTNSLIFYSKKINKCGHDDKQHYAKGLCNNCYHKFGRTKKPWNCPHQKLYAAGMCQNCYINNYNKKKRLNRDNGQTEQFEHELKMEESFNSHIVDEGS